MDSGFVRQRSDWMRLVRPRRALWSMVAGIILDVATVTVCALNAVSAQQAVAMALPAALITAGSFIALLVPDPWCAWRRGFMHGCEAAARRDRAPAAVNVDQKGLRTVRLTA
jgi:hypothetical protein